MAIGRFGRKANKATIKDQVALALAADIGLDNSLVPGAGGSTEVSDDTIAALTFYIQTLAPPTARTPGNAATEHGAAIFRSIGCSGCHLPTMHTAPAQEVAALSDQEIHPYTDLLLHDMGPDLADHRPDFAASGSEWRTPPLWGIGLQALVMPYACYLHDGRARSLSEAILWHGGQAAGQRAAFVALSPADRADLLSFLQSL